MRKLEVSGHEWRLYGMLRARRRAVLIIFHFILILQLLLLVRMTVGMASPSAGWTVEGETEPTIEGVA